MTNKDKQINILIVNFKVLQWIYEAIIPELREKMNARFFVIAPISQRDTFIKLLLPANDTFFAYDDIENKCKIGYGLTTVEEEAKARANEDKYDISYYREIVQQDRTLSTPFLSHAPWSPYATKEIYGSEYLTRLVNGYMKASEEILENNKIDLAIVWPVTGLTASLVAVAEHNKIPVTYPYNSKYKGYCLWANSAYQDDQIYEESFKNVGPKEAIEQSEVPSAASVFSSMSDMDARYSFGSIFNKIAKSVFFRLEFLILDLIKFDFNNKNRVSIYKVIMQLLYSKWFYTSFSKLCEKNIDKFSSKPFLFFALSMEPEFAIQGKCKEFNDQSVIIRQLAMGLPSGYELVIKEHYQLGRRHLNFYKDLLKFPNIRMAHPGIKGIELAKKARAVATMAGSISLEASLLGKPVLEFSTHSTFSFLPNVRTVTNFHTIPQMLREVMRELSDEEVDEIRRVSAAVPEAIERISFDGTETPFFEKVAAPLSPVEVSRIIELLIDIFEKKSVQ